MIWALLAGAVATIVTAIVWKIRDKGVGDSIERLLERRRTSSRMASRGEFVEGESRVPVALSLTNATFFYENSSLRAYFDLQLIRGVEYDNCLGTGRRVKGGKVLRLRCSDEVFEFVLPDEVVTRWHMMLPPRREAPNQGRVTYS